MSIRVERATIHDVEPVVALFEKYRAFYRCTPDAAHAQEFIAARLRNGDSTIYLGHDDEVENRAVGLMQLYPLFSSTAMKRLWLLNDLYVEESHRRRGVGRMLITAALELCKITQARGVFLETESTNEKAHALYEGMGLTRITNYFYGRDI